MSGILLCLLIGYLPTPVIPTHNYNHKCVTWIGDKCVAWSSNYYDPLCFFKGTTCDCPPNCAPPPYAWEGKLVCGLLPKACYPPPPTTIPFNYVDHVDTSNVCAIDRVTVHICFNTTGTHFYFCSLRHICPAWIFPIFTKSLAILGATTPSTTKLDTQLITQQVSFQRVVKHGKIDGKIDLLHITGVHLILSGSMRMEHI